MYANQGMPMMQLGNDSLDGLLFEKSVKALLFVTALIVFLLSLPCFFARGIGTADDSSFLIIAKWIGHGLNPYKDLVDVKPPGIYYTLYALRSFFGDAWWVNRVFILAVDILCIMVAMIIGTKTQGRLVGVLSGLYAYPTLILFWGHKLFAEQFCAFFGLIAIALIYRKEDSSLKHSYIYGLLIGISTLYKQTAIIFFLAYIFFLVMKAFRKKIVLKWAISLVSCALTGFLTIWAIMFFLLYSAGILNESMHSIFILPFVYPFNMQYSSLLVRIACTPFTIIFALSAIVIVKYGMRRIKDSVREDSSLLLLVALCSLPLLIVRPGSFHYVIPTLLPAIIIAAQMWSRLIVVITDAKPLPVARFVKSRIFIGALFVLPAIAPFFVMSSMSYFFIREGRLQFDRLQTYEIGSKINQYLQREDEPILCASFGFLFLSRMYYLLERRPFFKDALIVLNDRQRSIRYKETLEAIEKGKTSVVILEKSTLPFPFEKPSIEDFRAMLAKRYKRVPLRFAVDASRKIRTELYVRNDILAVERHFQSRVFPKSNNTSVLR